MAAGTKNETSLNQTLPSRNSSKSERTLLDGAASMPGVEQEKTKSKSSSQRSLAGAKSVSDLEAQRSFDLAQKPENGAEKQDPNLVRISYSHINGTFMLIVFLDHL